ncbi:hypothetical protein BD414DRAFT_91548 [Trametes punicea]|nr:hypothetical protein BD414DRAFT_91548 [Trametes punicea]
MYIYFCERAAYDEGQDRGDHSPAPPMYSGLRQAPALLINATFALTVVELSSLIVLVVTLLLSRPLYQRVWCCSTSSSYVFWPRTLPALDKSTTRLHQLPYVLLKQPCWQACDMPYGSARVAYIPSVLPYLAAISLSLGVAAFGFAHTDQILHNPDELTCTLHNRTLITATQIIVATTLALAIYLETFAIIHTLTTRKYLPQIPQIHLSLSDIARVILFTVLQALFLITLRTYIQSDSLRIACMLPQALVPIVTALNFGLNTKCYQTWKRAASGLPRSWFPRRPQHQFHGPRESASPEVVIRVDTVVEKDSVRMQEDDKPVGVLFE